MLILGRGEILEQWLVTNLLKCSNVLLPSMIRILSHPGILYTLQEELCLHLDAKVIFYLNITHYLSLHTRTLMHRYM